MSSFLSFLQPRFESYRECVVSIEGKSGEKDQEFSSKKKITCNIFLDIIQQEWEDLDDDVLLGCINSMPKWVQACIDAEGGHIKY